MDRQKTLTAILFAFGTVSGGAHSGGAHAFRACDNAYGDAFTASTYTVGELEFDPVTGLATGTQTTYNHPLAEAAGFSECHVTYALSGSYTPVAGTFVLDGERSSYSADCPSHLIDADYPASRYIDLQMVFLEDGSSEVAAADSGELLARGSWRPGQTHFKTKESCRYL
jgi:hypothetical protein